MLRSHRLAKPVLALVAVAGLGLLLSGCVFLKPGSLALSQPGAVGSVRVHFVLCTVGEETCSANTESKGRTVQFLIGIAVPTGSTAPASITALSVKGSTPLVFTRSDEATSEIAAAATAWQKVYTEGTQKEKEEAEAAKPLIGGPWPPSGMQGFGYISTPYLEAKGANLEWSLDADFGLPTEASGTPFTGPFAAAMAAGSREVTETMPASRPVHCAIYEKGAGAAPADDAICSGTEQQAQVDTSDLTIAAPKKPAQAFVGGSGEVDFPLSFASTAASSPSFTLSATTTAKGGKVKLGAKTFKPGNVNAKTHLAPTATGKVKVSVPRSIKPGTYEVTLAAKTAQGGTATGTAKLKVAKPKLKLTVARVNAATGTATLRVKVPGAGKLTISGKGIATVKKKAKKAQTLTVIISSTAGARVRVKATFKPKSGISVSKTKSIVL
ncbi:MAG TPA: hypothetical protein VMT37_06620 [Solirubrobacterales bacterium]|nr:hypothetical protein [Solirubrobacterales bacterium]